MSASEVGITDNESKPGAGHATSPILLHWAISAKTASEQKGSKAPSHPHSKAPVDSGTFLSSFSGAERGEQDKGTTILQNPVQGSAASPSLVWLPKLSQALPPPAPGYLMLTLVREGTCVLHGLRPSKTSQEQMRNIVLTKVPPPAILLLALGWEGGGGKTACSPFVALTDSAQAKAQWPCFLNKTKLKQAPQAAASSAPRYPPASFEASW